MKRSIPVFALTAIVLLTFGTVNPASADLIDVTICTLDGSDQAPLNGSTVEAQEGTNPVSSGQTGVDGCVTLSVEVTTIVGIDGELPGFGSLQVGSAFPNPFEGAVEVPFSNDITQTVEIGIFDLLGRQVSGLSAGSLAPGRYTFNVNGSSLPQGVYVYRLAGREHVATGQFVKVGSRGAGDSSVRIDRKGDVASSSKTQSSMLNITVARLGYQTLESAHEVENGNTVSIFLTKQSVTSDFEFAASALQVSFTNQSAGADTYSWNFGDGTSSADENPQHLFLTEGEYTVSLTSSLGEVADSVSKVVSVTATAGDNEKVPMDRSDLFTSGESYFGEAYTWPNDSGPDPVGTVIVGTGYSNASQHFSTYDSQYQSLMNPEFINCGVGSNAIENWIGQNTVTLFEGCISEIEAAGYTAADVGLTINLIANQVQYPVFPEAGSGVAMLETQVQEMGVLLEQYFPNAINTYTTGEPAHWVASTKCPRICEPVRFETAFGVNRALAQMNPDKHIHGAYLWSAVGIPNASGEEWVCEDYNVEGAGCPVEANQHPSNEGREKASRIYHAFFSAKYPNWYPKQ